MDNTKKHVKDGLGIIGTLTLIFVVLKLTGRIHWGWVWVLSPIWIGVAFFVVFFLLLVIAVRKDLKRR